MSKSKIIGIVLGVLVLAVIIAAVVVNAKFGVIVASPRVSYEKLVKPETRIQVVANVPLFKDFIEKKYLKGTSVPPWVLPLALPYEAALVVDPEYALNDAKVTLFVNDKRLAPIILEQANRLKIPPPFDQWFADKMVSKGSGQLVREGRATLDRTLVGQLREQWKGAKVSEPLHLEGGHMIEAALDNRDGGAMAALLGAAAPFAAQKGIDIGGALNSDMAKPIVPNIKSLRVQVDLPPDNTLKLRIALECDPSMVQMINMFFQMALQPKGSGTFPSLPELANNAGITLQGKAAVNGNVVQCDLTVPGFDAVLARFM